MSLGWIKIEGMNRSRMLPEQLFNGAYWTGSNPQPDEFGRMPVQQTARLKVRIL